MNNSSKIVSIDAVHLATIGASLLKETVRVLEANGMSRNLAPACLVSAMCGCMKMSHMSETDLISGVKAASSFWREEGDNVVFLPDVEGLGGQQEAADDCEKN